ncbi:MAG: BON domain-containing protein [Burkholderiales bacterium]|jgi:osmotically-inducible protein OsmY|nr:BON domain-containing protein [Burkholderiales bacterium]
MMRPSLPFALLVVLPFFLSGCFPVVATGVGAGVLMADDRRTSGIYIEDQNIELKVANRIAERFGSNTHVNVTSFNLAVLLTGEVPDEATRAAVAEIAKGVPNVRQVFNETVIGQPSSFPERSHDTYLTTRVKARMVDARKFNANHVKVVTEAGVVYLMGLVKRAEAEAATDIAATTPGVKRVVRLFEYLD